MRNLFLLLFFVSLLLGAAWEQKPIGWHQWGTDDAVYNVLSYGAVADAVEATDCDAAEDTPMDCDTVGTGTDNGPAISAAVAAAGAAGGGVVYIPCGLYSIATAIVVDQSNITIEGDGECSVLLTRMTGNPHYAIAVCDEYADTCAGQLENVHIRNLAIRDDDPFKHGLKVGNLVLEADSVSAAFDYGETITFADVGSGSGGATARFYWQDTTGAAAGNDKAMIFTALSGTVLATDTIAGDESGSTAVVDSVTTPVASEESHGIQIARCDNCSVEGTRISFMGDEPIDIGKLSTNVLIDRNFLDNNPATPSSGGGVTVQSADGVTISDNFCEGGLSAGPVGSSACMSISAQALGTSDNITFSNNHIRDKDTGNNNHTDIEIGISIASSLGDIDNVSIDGGTIDLDIDVWGVCDIDDTYQIGVDLPACAGGTTGDQHYVSNGANATDCTVGGGADTHVCRCNGAAWSTTGVVSACDQDSDCGGTTLDGNFCGTHNRSCDAGYAFCGAIIGTEGGAGDDIYAVQVSNASITGKVYLRADPTLGNVSITGNQKIEGLHDIGVRADGGVVDISNNSNISGHELGCIFIVASGVVGIEGNRCSAQGRSATAGGVIGVYDGSAASKLNIVDNRLVGENAAGGNVNAIDCKDIAGSNVSLNNISSADYAAIANCNIAIGNRISGGGYGINSPPANSVISLNKIVSATSGVNIASVAGGVVTSNNISGAGGKGIDIDGMTGGVVTTNVIASTGDAIETTASTYLNRKDNVSLTSGVVFDFDAGVGSTDVDNLVTP